MKNRVRSWIVLAVIFIVETVIAFALPFSHTGVFWISYLFSVVAIAVQVYVLQVAFYKEKTVKSKFYGFPVANVGVIYMLVQLVAGFVFMALAMTVPMWVPVVLYTILLGAAAIGFISADAMRDEVERQDVQLKKDVSAMRTLQSKINGIVGICNSDIRPDVEELADALRYSDPVSNAALTEIETELDAYINELQEAIVDNDNTSVRALCKKIGMVLVERNRLCKLNK